MNTIIVSGAAVVNEQSLSSRISSLSITETASSTGMYTLLYMYTVNTLLAIVTTSAVVSDQSSSSASNDDDTVDDDDDDDDDNTITNFKEGMYYMLLCVIYTSWFIHVLTHAAAKQPAATKQIPSTTQAGMFATICTCAVHCYVFLYM